MGEGLDKGDEVHQVCGHLHVLLLHRGGQTGLGDDDDDDDDDHDDDDDDDDDMTRKVGSGESL